jgi:tRNA(Ile)-lysidine synthase
MMSLPPCFMAFMDARFSKDCPAHIAVAVSGGGDSMALAGMLLEWRCMRAAEFTLHILSVDHGFRQAAKAEISLVTAQFGASSGVVCQAMQAQWDEGLPQSALMKQARQMRYGLMRDYCEAQGIKHLFLAHHRDDQAETFLIRLAKGSGIDGLAGMREVQPYDESGLSLVRPLLGCTHEQLLDYCRAAGITWSEDPTNENLSYTRNRLRASRSVLEEEGLSAVRLGRVAERCGRARDALEFYTDEALKAVLLSENEQRIEMDFERCSEYPLEIVIRLFLHAYDRLCPDKYYRPRFEKLEKLVFEVLERGADFKGRTLGGLHVYIHGQALVFKQEAKNEQ